MKKANLFLTFCTVVCIAGVATVPAFAEDNIFGDLSTVPPVTSDIQAPTVKVEQPVVIRGTSQMNKSESLTTQSLQNTISSLEAAQADLRTKLETATNNYNTVNQEYLRVKQERNTLKKIVRKTNSRIKSLERTKKNIQKTIQSEI